MLIRMHASQVVFYTEIIIRLIRNSRENRRKEIFDGIMEKSRKSWFFKTAEADALAEAELNSRSLCINQERNALRLHSMARGVINDKGENARVLVSDADIAIMGLPNEGYDIPVKEEKNEKL